MGTEEIEEASFVQFGVGLKPDTLKTVTQTLYSQSGADASGAILYEKRDIQTPLRVIKTNVDGKIVGSSLALGSEVIASYNDLTNYAKLIRKMVLEIDTEQALSLALVGEGLLWLPPVIERIGNWVSLTLFELYPEIGEWNEAKQPELKKPIWSYIYGDYRETMAESYDIIIFDASDKDVSLLTSKLKDGGKLYIVGDL